MSITSCGGIDSPGWKVMESEGGGSPGGRLLEILAHENKLLAMGPVTEELGE